MQHSREYYVKGTMAEELDFALFEVDEARAERDRKRKEANRQEKMKKNREKQAEQGRKKNQPLTIVDKYGKFQVALVLIAAVMFIALLGLMVANQQKINDINHDIKNKTAELTVLEQDYEVMKISFESKMSDAAIEQYAINELGMQHRENNQTEWLSLNNKDVFEDCGSGRSSIFYWKNH